MTAPSWAEGGADLRTLRRTQAFASQLATTRALVGFGERDEQRVAATRDVIAAAAGGIAERFYAHLMAHRETAAAFEDADGRTDRELVAALHDSLRGWLITAVEAPLDERLAAYLAGIARAHTGRGAGKGTRVKARYMVAAMGYLQTSLVEVLGVSGLNAEELLETASAWDKLLMIHLDLFLAVYGSAGGTAHWY
jgi:hypothetical protein